MAKVAGNLTPCGAVSLLWDCLTPVEGIKNFL